MKFTYLVFLELVKAIGLIKVINQLMANIQH